MKIARYLATAVSTFAVGVEAVITTVDPVVGAYFATSTSSISLTLKTAISINAIEDYHVVFGIYPVGATAGTNYISKRWHYIDLIAAGLSSTSRSSNITLSKLPLTSAYFPANLTSPTPYVIALALTTGTGTEIRANYTVAVRTLTVPVNVTSILV